MNEGSETGFIRKYIKLHNEGVESGDFQNLYKLFSGNTEMYFENISFGPLIGIESIKSAFETNPPNDKLIIHNERIITENEFNADYSWNKNPGTKSGEIYVKLKNNLIELILVKSI